MSFKFARSFAVASYALSSCLATAAESDLSRASTAAGLSPTVLAACGSTGPEVTAFFNAVRATPQLAAVIAAQSDLTTCERTLAAAVRRCDPLDPEGFSRIQSATSRVTTAKASLNLSLSAFLELGCSTLASTQRTRMTAWRNSSADLPPAFRVLEWSQAETSDLLAALLDERLAQSTQSTIPASSASILAAARARTEVVQATLNLQSNLPQVTAAFVEALR